MKSLKIMAMVAVALAGGLLASETLASSSGSGVFSTALSVLQTTFRNVRVIVYVLGAFGLIGLAVGGIMGAIKWKWLGALACGLGIVAVADLVVNYALDVQGNGLEDIGGQEIDFEGGSSY